MILNFLSIIYRVILILREILFRIGVFKRKKLDCSIVSVGNITLGGTGKTPCVKIIAELIAGYGKKVVLISRGYRRKSKGLKIVFDGKKILGEVENSGDEPYYLAKTLKNIPVIVCKDRYKAGLLAINEFLSNCLILDDGFQRRYSLYRDLDIVLIDSTNPFGNYELFPAGILREPLNKIKEADIFILTKVDFANDKEKLKEELIRIKKDCIILESVYTPVCFLWNGNVKDLSLIKNKKVILLSSIANPFYFERIISKFDCDITEHLKYPDHYDYSYADITKIEKKFKDLEANYLITTEKDAVRLNVIANNSEAIPVTELPIYSLKIEFEILDNGKEKLIEIFKVKGII